MLLGRSSQDDDGIDLNGTVHNEVDSGVEHGELLLSYADAAVGRTPQSWRRPGEALNEAMGPDAVVDCAADIANFQRMVRIADGCGIPLDDFTRENYPKWQEGLKIDGFRSRENTFG